jgi:hypothetical protein
MYLLAFELTGRRDAAWLAGLAFACLPYRTAQITHLQVLVAGWMPIALLGLHRYFRTGSARALAGFVAAFVLTALSNGYYLFFLAMPAVIVAAWHLLDRIRRRERVRRAATALAIAGAVIGLALAPVAAAYLRVHEARGFVRTRADAAHYAASPSDYATVPPATSLWAGTLPVGRPERELFPGLTLAVLAVVGLSACRRHSAARVYALVTIVAVAMTFGPEPDLGLVHLTTGPYDWFRLLPGADGLRVPARFAMVAYLGMAVLAAFGVAWAAPRLGRPAALALMTLGSLAMAAEQRCR